MYVQVSRIMLETKSSHKSFHIMSPRITSLLLSSTTESHGLSHITFYFFIFYFISCLLTLTISMYKSLSPSTTTRQQFNKKSVYTSNLQLQHNRPDSLTLQKKPAMPISIILHSELNTKTASQHVQRQDQLQHRHPNPRHQQPRHG